MFKVLVNYNFTPEMDWIGDYYLIYDRSDLVDPKKVVHTENVGNVDYDKLTYLVENYDNLPDVFLWGKTNLFKYITREEYETVKDNQSFTPLLTQHHKTKDGVCYYEDGMYYEKNPLLFGQGKYCNNYPEFAEMFGFPNPDYIPFAPGGNYILTRETVHKHTKELYEKMASILPYTKEPIEAHFCERVYYTLWK